MTVETLAKEVAMEAVRLAQCDACGQRVARLHSHEWTLENGVPDGSFCCKCNSCGEDCFDDEEMMPFVPEAL